MASRTPTSEPCKYVLSYILDERIIGSKCLDIWNIYSMDSGVFNVLIKKLEGLLT